MKKGIVFIICFVIVSCVETSKPTISKDKMINLIYELTLASSIQSVSSQKDSIVYFVNPNTILKKYGVDSLSFVKEQEYYHNHPEEYLVIYDSVKNRVQKDLEKIKATPADKDDEKLEVNLKELKKSSRLIFKEKFAE